MTGACMWAISLCTLVRLFIVLCSFHLTGTLGTKRVPSVLITGCPKSHRRKYLHLLLYPSSSSSFSVSSIPFPTPFNLSNVITTSFSFLLSASRNSIYIKDIRITCKLREEEKKRRRRGKKISRLWYFFDIIYFNSDFWDTQYCNFHCVRKWKKPKIRLIFLLYLKKA